jgi:RNA polymerase sigma-70 factor (ECF subfamily)
MTDFTALYQRYAPEVRRFSLFLCGDPTLADDLTSETFVRAWTAAGEIRQETVKAYLFTIARNLYRDTLRRARGRASLPQQVRDERASADQETADRSELAYVLSAMQHLPESDRAALLMRAQEEMSYREIAQVLGITVVAAKVRVHRARLKLVSLTRGPTTPRHASETP